MVKKKKKFYLFYIKLSHGTPGNAGGTHFKHSLFWQGLTDRQSKIQNILSPFLTKWHNHVADSLPSDCHCLTTVADMLYLSDVKHGLSDTKLKTMINYDKLHKEKHQTPAHFGCDQCDKSNKQIRGKAFMFRSPN